MHKKEAKVVHSAGRLLLSDFILFHSLRGNSSVSNTLLHVLKLFCSLIFFYKKYRLASFLPHILKYGENYIFSKLLSVYVLIFHHSTTTTIHSQILKSYVFYVMFNLSFKGAHTHSLCSDTRTRTLTLTRTHFSTHPSTHSVAQWASVIDLVSTIFTVPANNSVRHLRCNTNNVSVSLLISTANY